MKSLLGDAAWPLREGQAHPGQQEHFGLHPLHIELPDSLALIHGSLSLALLPCWQLLCFGHGSALSAAQSGATA